MGGQTGSGEASQETLVQVPVLLDQGMGGGEVAQAAASLLLLQRERDGLFLPWGMWGAGEACLGGGCGRGVLSQPLGYGSLSLYVRGVQDV